MPAVWRVVDVLLTTTAVAALGITLANEIRPGDFLAVEASGGGGRSRSGGDGDERRE